MSKRGEIADEGALAMWGGVAFVIVGMVAFVWYAKEALLE